MEINRKAFLTSLGGAAALNMMSDEAKADALEEHMMFQLNQATPNGPGGGAKFPTAAEIEAQIETRPSRRGVGNLFVSPRGNVKKLPPLPANLTMDTSNGKITGTPEAGTDGIHDLTFTVQDSSTPTPQTASRTLSLTIKH